MEKIKFLLQLRCSCLLFKDFLISALRTELLKIGLHSQSECKVPSTSPKESYRQEEKLWVKSIENGPSVKQNCGAVQVLTPPKNNILSNNKYRDCTIFLRALMREEWLKYAA